MMRPAMGLASGYGAGDVGMGLVSPIPTAYPLPILTLYGSNY